jgi:hypothetical protein
VAGERGEVSRDQVPGYLSRSHISSREKVLAQGDDPVDLGMLVRCSSLIAGIASTMLFTIYNCEWHSKFVESAKASATPGFRYTVLGLPDTEYARMVADYTGAITTRSSLRHKRGLTAFARLFGVWIPAMLRGSVFRCTHSRRMGTEQMLF